MRWLLLPFRFCLYFPFYALFGSLRWLTRDYDRFVRFGSKITVVTVFLWITAALSGYRVAIYFPPDVPVFWVVIFLICLWCGVGWLLSRRPVQWLFGGIADYCRAAILPPKPAPKPKKQKAQPLPPPPKEHIAAIATKGVASGADLDSAVQQLSPEMLRFLLPPDSEDAHQ